MTATIVPEHDPADTAPAIADELQKFRQESAENAIRILGSLQEIERLLTRFLED